MGKLYSIQVLRAVAALLVLFGHALHWESGGTGVDLFFVISGFIMASIAPGRTWQQFMADRFWRIMPLWWINVLPWFLIAAFAGSLSYERSIASLTLWPVFSKFTQPYLGLGWTLMFEMLFYVSVAVSIRFDWKIPAAVFLAFALTGGSTPLAQFLGNPMIVEFALGVAIYCLPQNPRVGAVALFCGAVLLPFVPGLLVAGPSLIPQTMTLWLRVAMAGSLAGLIVYGALAHEKLFRHPKFTPLVHLGDASYSLYLSHWLLVKYLPIAWPIRVALSIAVALAMFRFIETPLRHARLRVLRASPA